MFKWAALTTEVRGFLALAAFGAAIFLISKVVKGDISGAARMLGAGLIGLIAMGFIFIMATPDTAQALVSKFIGN